MEPAPLTARLAVRVTADRPALTLYDLTEGLLDVEAFIHDNEQAIIDAGGDLDAIPGLVELLDRMEGKFVEKVERLVLFIQNRSAMQKARKETADQFKRMADADAKVVDSLKAYLVRCQRRANWTKIETAKCKSTVVANSVPSVERGPDLIALGELHAHAAIEVGAAKLSETVLTDDQLALAPFDVIRGELAGGRLVNLVDPDSDADTIAGQVLAMIVETRSVTYSLDRAKILERWHKAFDKAVDEITAAAAPDETVHPFDLDQRAHDRANADPVLRLLGVTVTQGYHVRVK